MNENPSGIDIIAFSKNKKLYHVDPSFIYRCLNIASVFKSKKILNYIGHIKNYRENSNTKIVYLHRPVYSLSLALLVRRLKRKNIKIVADVDDLIIHPDFSDISPAVVNKILSQEKVSKQFNKNYRALSLCDQIMCSTSQLKHYLDRYFDGTIITVLHNCIYHTWSSELQEDNQEKIITYFPGTKSHDRDFSLIQTPLEEFLRNTPSAHLKIVGPLETNLNVMKDQISFSKKVPFYLYDRLVSKSSINLAPLEESKFNSCKSALKAVEAGSFGIPTIFSPNPDAARFEGSSVLIAKSDDDWYKQLENLFKPSSSFNRELCRNDVIFKSDIHKIAERFLSNVSD